MNNLMMLYKEDGDFREAAIDYAADLIGTTSHDFAKEWLEMGANDIFAPEKVIKDGADASNDENAKLKRQLDKAFETIKTKDSVIFALTDEVNVLRGQISTAAKALAYERDE